MAVRFLPDAAGFNLATERTQEQIEGAGQIWSAWLRNATVIPSLFIENENGDVREVDITEPVVVKSPFKSIKLSNVAGFGTLRVAVSDSICDDISLGGIGNVIVAPEGVQCSGHELQGPVVGEFSYIELFNPADSGFNLFFDSVWVEFSGSVSLQFRTDTEQRGSLSSDTTRIAPFFTDLRNTGTPVGIIGRFSDNTTAGLGTGITSTITQLVFNDTNVRPPFPFIITPGNSLLMRSLLANRSIFASPFWRELPE